MSLLQHLALSSPLSYLAAFLIPMLDAILPVLPSETIVIALGVSTAGSTDPRIALLVGSSSPERRAPAGGPGRPGRWTGSAPG